MVDLLSLPDEILTDILDIGGHTTIVVCQQARILIDNSQMDVN
jgi:hypothetical protein